MATGNIITLSNGKQVDVSNPNVPNRVVDMRFNPNQLRDLIGRWALGGTKGGRNPQEQKKGKTASTAKGAAGQKSTKSVPKSKKKSGDGAGVANGNARGTTSSTNGGKKQAAPKPSARTRAGLKDGNVTHSRTGRPLNAVERYSINNDVSDLPPINRGRRRRR